MPNVKDFRLKFGLNQRDFGCVFGITAKAVSNIETGFRKPSRTVLKILCLFNELPDAQVRAFISKLSVQPKPQSRGIGELIQKKTLQFAVATLELRRRLYRKARFAGDQTF